MKIIADLQIHSRYARATSKDITLDNLEKWAKIKGLDLLGTGDFQHPEWNKEIKNKLKEDENGILWSKNKFPFIWQTEISLMFSSGGKRRAVHLLVFAPNQKIANKIISYLSSKGRLDYDGRPIFGITCEQFVKDLKEIEESIEIIPAHCMTPWFGLYGSDSGFNSLAECFGTQVNKISAIESGMSADPGMLWRFKEKVQIVSFSDAHSFWPWRLGREATIFDINRISYSNIINAIRTGKGLAGTIETPPAYGKYHWDGHRNCNFSCSPFETKKYQGIYPICKKKMTIGVEYRVEEIAKEKEGYMPLKCKPYSLVVPLSELIAFIQGGAMTTKKNWEIYNSLISKFKNEFNILLDIKKEDFLKEKIDENLIEIILLNREGKLHIRPGYDGIYGVIQISKEKQAKLL